MDQTIKQKKVQTNSKIVFLLKSMKQEYIEETMKKGRFCFNHPSVFNKWENTESAQADKWDAHSAYEATHLMYAPVIGEKDGMPIYGEVKKLADKGIVRVQSNLVKHIPICCFRMVEQNEITLLHDGVLFSLGETAEKIMREFGHDSYIIVCAEALIQRLREKYKVSYGSVVYKDVLNDYEFDVGAENKDVVEQLFRKDEKFKWQKEFRFTLPSTPNSPVFVEIGSIEDIAKCGKISDLRE